MIIDVSSWFLFLSEAKYVAGSSARRPQYSVINNHHILAKLHGLR